jgi:hypothetical protein
MRQAVLSDTKRAVILSDNDLLFQAIAANLSHCLNMQIVGPGPGDQGGGLQPEDPLDLIVVALCGRGGEPVLALARASLAGQIGRVPILIISNRPFYPRPEEQVAYLHFPFRPDELQDRVRGLLHDG